MTPQHHRDPEPLTDRCMAITEPDEISTTPRNAHLEGQRTGSVSRTSRPFPASLIPGQPNRIVISQSWKRLLPGRRLRAQTTAGVRSKTKESLDASARSPNSRAGTQSASRLGVRLCQPTICIDVQRITNDMAHIRHCSLESMRTRRKCPCGLSSYWKRKATFVPVVRGISRDSVSKLTG